MLSAKILQSPEFHKLGYFITLGKAIYALHLGDPFILTDLFLKPADDWFKDLAKDHKANTMIETTRNQVLHELEPLLRLESSNIDIKAIASESDETFIAGFSFESLVENLEAPECIPTLWSSKRKVQPDGALASYHNQLLENTAHALIKVLPELPGFMHWFIGYVSQNMREQGRLNEAFKRLLNQQETDDLDFEQRFLEAMAKKLDSVELFIERPDLPDETRQQELTVAYVTLELIQGRDEEESIRSLPADAIFDTLPPGPHRVLIIGPAGSGKTTLLRWVGLEAARMRTAVDLVGMDNHRLDNESQLRDKDARRIESETSNVSSWRNKIPLLIRLRDCKEGSFPLSDQFHTWGLSGVKPPDGWAQRILDAGRGLLLLDGLDELPPPRRLEALTWIDDLTTNFSSENIFVVSSRPQAVEADALTKAKFCEFSVRDLSPSGKVEFVHKWHDAVRQRLARTPDRIANLGKKQERLLRELSTNRSVALLAANPLLCALLCALNRVYQESLPENLYDLCESACKMLLYDRDRLQNIAITNFIPDYDNLKYPERLIVLQHLAYNFVKSEQPDLSKAAAKDIVATTLYGAMPDRAEEVKAAEILRGLIDRSGLLRGRGEDEIEFVHNSLRDYLASLLLVHRKEYRFLVSQIDSGDLQKWEPVILFCAATSRDHEFGATLLNEILTFGNKGWSIRRRKPARLHREYVALKVAGRILYPNSLGRELTGKINDLRDQMLPIDTVEKAERITEIGESAIEYLAWHENSTGEVAAACVRCLARIKSEQADEQLFVYLKHDWRRTVLDALFQILPIEKIANQVNLLEIPFVLEQIQNGNLDPSYKSFIRDLKPLEQLTQLRTLYLSGTQVTDLKPLEQLTQLQILDLQDTQVTNLEPIQQLTQLERLFLRNTQVTDFKPIQQLVKRGLRVFGI